MEPGEKAWLRYVAAMHKCSASTKSLETWEEGTGNSSKLSSLATRSADCTVHDKNDAAATPWRLRPMSKLRVHVRHAHLRPTK